MKALSQNLKIDSLGTRLANALNVAKSEAFCSVHSFKHGAVLFRKGRILNVGHNQQRPVGWTFWQAHRYYNRTLAQHTMHAEISIMHRIKKEVLHGADALVVRVNKHGQFMNSKPCSYCERTMKLKNIRRCWYTLNNFELGVMEL